jgi:hypothetical protein
MSPVQSGVLGRAVEALEDILGSSGKVKRLQAEVLETAMEVLEARDHGVATDVVVRVPKDLDVGMEGLQSMLGVLRLSAPSQTVVAAPLLSSSLCLSVLPLGTL